jgi:hypothetical protein
MTFGSEGTGKPSGISAGWTTSVSWSMGIIFKAASMSRCSLRAKTLRNREFALQASRGRNSEPFCRRSGSFDFIPFAVQWAKAANKAPIVGNGR